MVKEPDLMTAAEQEAILCRYAYAMRWAERRERLAAFLRKFAPVFFFAALMGGIIAYGFIVGAF